MEARWLGIWLISAISSGAPADEKMSLCTLQSQAQDTNACVEDWSSLMQIASVVHERRPHAVPTLPEADALKLRTKTLEADTLKLSQELSSLEQKDAEEEGAELAALGATAKPATAFIASASVAAESAKDSQVMSKSFNVLDWLRKETQTMLASPVSLVIGRGLTIVGCSGLGLLVLLAINGHLKNWLPTPKIATPDELLASKQSWKVYLTLMSCAALWVTVTDQYLPNLVAMQADFKTTPETMSISLQVSWLATGLSALMMAGLADNFGRKTMLIMCMTFAVIGSLACAMAPSASWFIAARVLCGISEGGEAIIMMTIRDMFDSPDERMAYTSAFFIVWILMPTLAPALGGTIAHFLGWRAAFAVMTEWGLINIYLVTEKLKDTLPANKGGDRTWREYGAEVQRVLGDKHVMVLGIVQGLAMMTLVSVSTNFSQVLGDVFHQDQISIAWKLAVVVAVMVLPAIVAEACSGLVGATNVLRGSSACLLGPIIAAFIVGKQAWQTWEPLFATVLVSMLPVVPCGLAANSLYFQTLKEESGAASGMNKCLVMLITSLSTLASTYFIQNGAHKAQSLLFWIVGSFATLFVIFWGGFGWNPPRWAHPRAPMTPRTPRYDEAKEKQNQDLRVRSM